MGTLSSDAEARLIADYQAGAKMTDICQKYEIGVSEVYRLLGREGLPIVRVGRDGSAEGQEAFQLLLKEIVDLQAELARYKALFG